MSDLQTSAGIFSDQIYKLLSPFDNGNPRRTDWLLSLEPYIQEKRTDELSSVLYICWHLPIFPGRRQPSIVGTSELNFRVRNGNGWTLTVINTNSVTGLRREHSYFNALSLDCQEGIRLRAPGKPKAFWGKEEQRNNACSSGTVVRRDAPSGAAPRSNSFRPGKTFKCPSVTILITD